MLNVALTGNAAAGKSTVSKLFSGWGATLIDADERRRTCLGLEGAKTCELQLVLTLQAAGDDSATVEKRLNGAGSIGLLEIGPIGKFFYQFGFVHDSPAMWVGR